MQECAPCILPESGLARHARERTAATLLQSTRFARPLSLSHRLHADAQTGKGYTRTSAGSALLSWSWRSEKELGACSLQLNRLARIFGKFLASGFVDEGMASEPRHADLPAGLVERG